LFAVAVQSDGKIVAAGSSRGTAFLLARFNADGSLDQTFGTNGGVETTFGDQAAAGSGIVVQADGKIIVVGVSGAGPTANSTTLPWPGITLMEVLTKVLAPAAR
jgi:uncharacterized delta-60 repeat protein